MSQAKLQGNEIAIVGMSGRFPGAAGVDSFWRNLVAGVESIRSVSEAEALAAGATPEQLQNPAWVRATSPVDRPDLFDAEFFGYPPREAEVMDPQHRLFLECSWEALEDAGYDPARLGGLAGVFAGSGFCTYLLKNVAANPEVLALVGDLQAAVGNERDSLTSTVSYKLNLRGPSLAVQTFCSTSLVATHLACQSLLAYECDLALAGGVAISFPQGTGYLYQEGGILSPDGHCRTFDAGARGSVMGNGAGVVALKRYADALAGGDPVYALIRGSAVNNDGIRKVGYTAPGLDGQRSVIVEALANAGVAAESIGYYEAHGTATPLGDAVELAALKAAFGSARRRGRWCAIGSAKTNVGHLDRASGVTGLIKTALALRERKIPASLHFTRSNPELELEQSPFYVNTELADWPAADGVRRAGVSSFGLGGTNAHVVLEEAPEAAPSGPSRPFQLLAVAARTATALEAATENLKRYLAEHPELPLADVAHTLHRGRGDFNHRRVWLRDARPAATTAEADPVWSGCATHRDVPVAFLFPGVGDHYAGMGRDLYAGEPTFRAALDQAAELLLPHLGCDLRAHLLPAEAAGSPAAAGIAPRPDLKALVARGGDPTAGEPLHETWLAQPAVFAVEYALTRLLAEWGVEPAAMIGYSLGEYVAACVAGVLSLDDALRLVAARARLIATLPAGGMLAIAAGESAARELLAGWPPEVAVAALNGPAMTVVAGPQCEIDRLQAELDRREVAWRRLPTRHAFHSPMMERLAEPFRELLATVALHPPQKPYVTNVTGEWITAGQATDPEHWVRHLCSPVRFAPGLAALLAGTDRVALEVGPGQSLGAMVRQEPAAGGAERLVLHTVRQAAVRQHDQAQLLAALGRLWLAGASVDWSGFYAHESRRRVHLPTYPFERQSYWLAALPGSAATLPAAAPAAGRREIADWFYRPAWREQALAASPGHQDAPPAAATWLVLADEAGVGDALAARLTAAGRRVITAVPAPAFARLDEDRYALDPCRSEDFAALLAELRQLGRLPEAVVHLWLLGTPADAPLAAALDLGFHAVVALAQAMGGENMTRPLRLAVAADGLSAAPGGAPPQPGKSAVLAALKVLPQEHPHLTCLSLDVAPAAPPAATAAALLAHMAAADPGVSVALRGERRLVETFAPEPLAPPAASRLRQGGVYLITGGLGGVGMVLARHLAARYQARLVLTGRSGLPPRDSWARELSARQSGAAPTEAAARIAAVQELETAGGEVLVVAADVASEEQMAAALAAAEARFGPLHGVIHAAGISGDRGFRVAQQLTRADCELHFRPKIHGLLVLDRLLAGRELDFRLLMSSLSAVLGGITLGAYAAANQFLDAWVDAASAAADGRWTAVDWDTWQLRADQHAVVGRSIAAFEMTPPEGIDAFERILAHAEGRRLVHSTGDLAARRAQWIERRALAAPAAETPQAAALHTRPHLQTAFVPAGSDLERRIAAIWQRILGIQEVGVEDNYFDLGGTSLTAIQVVSELQKALGAQVSPIILFEAPTIGRLARLLGGDAAPAAAQAALETTVGRRREVRRAGGGGDIAIVGMAGRFPGAADPAALWRNLCDGVEALTAFSDDELAAAGVPAEVYQNPAYVRARPMLADVDCFDAQLFGYSPREATFMDPQHRILLQCAWHALEDAGYDALRYPGSVGVFAGSNVSNYWLQLMRDPDLVAGLSDAEASIASDRDSLTTRISYKLNLRGPSFTVQTFCSTSAVAVHLACQSLLAGDCDIALAGGVSLRVPQRAGHLHQPGGQDSRDGHTRTFDAAASGTVFGDGVGLLVLRRLPEALASGDTVRAVIKGSAINNDGAQKIGYTAPSVDGQAAVVAMALDAAGLTARDIDYVEAHGTATELGDPIEVAALTKAYRLTTEERGFCALGSVKANLGHLDRAAGVTAIIKTALSLQAGRIPGLLHYERPNPKLDIEASPFRLARETRPWPAVERPRRAGVNCLGVGGTNVHLVMEQAPALPPQPPHPEAAGRAVQLLLLSARTAEALDEATANLAAHLAAVPEQELADVAYTLQVGRRELEHRRAVLCGEREDAIAVLGGGDAERRMSHSVAAGAAAARVVFLLPGLGDHYEEMAAGLYRDEPRFREVLDRCAELLLPELGMDVRQALFPRGVLGAGRGLARGTDLRRLLAARQDAAGDGGDGDSAGDEAGERLLDRTEIAQPALFAVEVALAELLLGWGIQPEAMVGYSLGEYTAAYLAGVFTLPDALRLVARRARAIGALPRGAMLAVSQDAAALAPLLGDGLALAACNGPGLSVIAGPPAAIDALATALAAQGAACRRLRTGHAFHSPQMEPARAELVALVASLPRQAPRIPYLSNLTGRWIGADEAVDPEYWGRQLCETVQFGDAAACLLAEPGRVYLEVGPGQGLGSFVKQHPAASAACAVVPAMRAVFETRSDAAHLVGALGRLWLAGAPIDWAAFHGAPRRRVPLPLYPFARERYWIEPRRDARPAGADLVSSEARAELADWFYVQEWRHEEPAAAAADDAGRAREAGDAGWLLLLDPLGVGDKLAEMLRARGERVVTVVPGTAFAGGPAAGFTIDPASRADYGRLLAAARPLPRRLVHLWTLAPDADTAAAGAAAEFFGLFHLLQALGEMASAAPAELAVVTRGVAAVAAGEAIEPRRALVLGPAKVGGQEVESLHCRVIDLGLHTAGTALEGAAEAAARLAAELALPPDEMLVALRDDGRWVRRFEPRRLPAPPGADALPAGLRQGGVYLITGGMGGIGLALAEHLHARCGARLVLVGRSPLPPRDEWPALLAGDGAAAGAGHRLARLLALEEAGAQLLTAAAAVEDEAAMRQVVEAAERRFGTIHGVFHLAGIPGQGLIQHKTDEAAAAVLAAKVGGTEVLDRLLGSGAAGRPAAELFVLFSSMSAITGGGPGQADYCAANAYLDAFAAARTAAGGPRTVAVGWGEWRWDAWDAGLGGFQRQVQDYFKATRRKYGIEFAEGMAALERILEARQPHVVVATQDFRAMVAGSAGFTAARILAELRQRLPQQPAHPRPALGVDFVAATGELERRIALVWQRVLGLAAVGVQDNFFDLGGSSLIGLQLTAELARELGREVSSLALYEAPTVRLLARHLAPAPRAAAGGDGAEAGAEAELLARRRQAQRAGGQTGAGDVAIVGMAGRFPGAANVRQLWQNLLDGVESVTFWSDQELLAAGVAPAMLADPNYVRAGQVLDGIDLFDAQLFGYSPREAETMDPQHRLFLECAWEALEDAGYDPDRYPGLIGLFGGADASTYVHNLRAHAHLAEGAPLTVFQAGIGNTNDSLATRVSYKLNLRGPSLTVQTFCSTSAVAAHLACRSLAGGECDLALAGGVRVHVPHIAGYVFQEGGIEPPDGHTRTFDARGKGAVLGNGVALLVLKRLADALADGDTVHAVIKGSAINNDGSLKVGYTAPSIEGQAQVIGAALEQAGVDPDTVSYIEAHGTATEIGDPIEVAALSRAYRGSGGRAGSDAGGRCALGSLKPNVGHLDRASGATALIKTALALSHRTLPATINFAQPNPRIDFAGSPFRVVDRREPWAATGGPRRAAVNSVGLGGTNVHLILEEAPAARAVPGPARPWQLLLLAARSERSLEGATDALAAHLAARPRMDAAELADAAYTLQVGRRRLEHRRFVVAQGAADAAAALSAREPRQVLGRRQAPVERPVAFLLPGVGDHQPGTAHELYDHEPAFREAFDRCARLLVPHLGLDIRGELFAAPAPTAATAPTTAADGAGRAGLRALLGRGAAAAPAPQRLHETWLAQPVVFALDYALACLWLSWGVRPQALLGYSLGEYVAACLAGVFSLEDALLLVARRARLIADLPAGAMLAVSLPPEEAAQLAADADAAGGGLALAAVNAPAVSVVAGPEAAVAALAAELAGRGVPCRLLPTTHAFHTPMMQAIVAPFLELFAGIEMHPPQVPYLSNVTGDWIAADQATDPAHWARHLTGCVRFADALGRLFEEPHRVLLEVGPGQSLGAFASQHPACGRAGADPVIVASLPHAQLRQPEVAALLTSLGRLWLAGVEPDWHAFHGGERRRRTALPTYCFDRQRYWIEGPAEGAPGAATTAGKKADIADWFYEPAWQQEPLATAAAEAAAAPRWMLLDDGGTLAAKLAGLLAAGGPVVRVTAGASFAEHADGRFAIDPRQAADYGRLLERLAARDLLPDRVAHLWLAGDLDGRPGDGFTARLAAAGDLGLWSLVHLARALAERNHGRPLQLTAVTRGAQAVAGGEPERPERATVLAACKVLPQEYPRLSLASLDVDLETPAAAIAAELAQIAGGAAVAWRQGVRFSERFAPVRLQPVAPAARRPRQGGVYLLTGGLGGVGLLMARHLAETCQARLILTSRGGLPPAAGWDAWVAAHGADDAVSKRIAAVREIEALGGEVMAAAVDVGDAGAMRQLVGGALERWGGLHGVIHAAGISGGEGFGVVATLRRETADCHLAPKVAGLLALEEALAGRSLDFCLVMSSLSAVLGGITLLGYTAANLCVDALAAARGRAGALPWTVVDWDTWKLRPGQHGLVGKTVAAYEMLPAEGLEVLERALAQDRHARLVISTGALDARLAQWIERRALRRAEAEAAAAAPPAGAATAYARPNLATAFVAAANDAEHRVAQVLQRILGIAQVGVHDNYFDMGGTSLTAIQVVADLQTEFGVQLSPIALFEAPTVRQLARLVAENDGNRPNDGNGANGARPGGEPGGLQAQAELLAQRTARLRQGGAARPAIALVGLAGRFPGAASVGELWELVRGGREGLSVFSDEELVAAGVDPRLVADPRYVKSRPVVDGIEMFDAQFFGYSPREADLTDPQHRLLVECAWQALEDAGYDSLRFPGAVGVFAGSNLSSYWINIAGDREMVNPLGDLETMIAGDRDSLATRISYKLNLRGPSFTVQAFCSTSAVAVHLACQSLAQGECDMALAGGVSLKIPQRVGYLHEEGNQESRDGHTRTFDAAASGTVFGDGVAMVVLKRLDDALADGDHIHAVVRGTGINNDGAGKAGYTAPSVEGQAAAIRLALTNAGVDPESISYVEAHGTATELGDPIEMAALARAYRGTGNRVAACAVGSVKTNVGHLDRAAGVTALIKTALALEHREIPASLHFQRPNPKLGLERTPFFVNTELRAWEAPGGAPRRAGLNCLGVGGTNVHMVLEEAPAPAPAAAARPWQLLVLSARTPAALAAAAANLSAHLAAAPQTDLADVAYTLQVGRREMQHRRVLVCRDTAEAVRLLGEAGGGRVLNHARRSEERREVAFLLPGLGEHQAGMAAGLYRDEPLFRELVDHGAAVLQPILGRDLRPLLFPAEDDRGAGGGAARPDFARLLRGAERGGPLAATELAQPATFLVEYALARLLMSWGVAPGALLGYSLGEYVAACLAGVISYDDALAVVAQRAQWIGELPPGGMLAVPVGEGEARQWLAGGLAIAAVNGPQQCVISGPADRIAALEAELAARQVAARRLQTVHAFHSPAMEPVRRRLVELLSGIELAPPRIPVISNVTGAWLTAGEATDPEYWGRHLCGAVRLGDGLGELLGSAGRVLVEVGPGQTLTALAKQHPRATAAAAAEVVPTLGSAFERQPDQAALLLAVGKLWLTGVEIDWQGFHGGARRRVPLPTYPFERQKHWLQPRQDATPLHLRYLSSEEKAPLDDWFYEASWEAPGADGADGADGEPAGRRDVAGRRFLVFLDGGADGGDGDDAGDGGDGGIGRALCAALVAAGAEVATAERGAAFARRGPGAYRLRPGERADYDALLADLAAGGRTPHEVAHLWTVGGDDAPPPAAAELDAALAPGFYSLLYLAQAWGERHLDLPLELTLVSSGVQQALGDEILSPVKAAALGPCKVLHQEYQQLSCRNVDVVAAEGAAALGPALFAELTAARRDEAVALRGGRVLRRRFARLALAAPAAEAGPAPCLRPQGVYLITGGMGGLGLALAEHLHTTVGARLVLVGRTPAPPAERWAELAAAAAGDADPLAERARGLAALAAAGAEVLTLTADAADETAMRQAVAAARHRFGALHGVFHLAAVPGEGLMQWKTADAARRVFGAKAAGALALLAALDGEPLDLCVLFSSMSAVTGGGPGQSDYCGANALVDALARRRAAAGGGERCVSIGWGEWQWSAWDSGLGGFHREVQDYLKATRRRYGIAAGEGMQALGRILAGDRAHVIVATQDFNRMVAGSSEFSAATILGEVAKNRADIEAHPRPVLGVEYVAAASEVERTVCRVWQQVLGLAQVGIDDNFFDLGGSSLIGLQVIANLKQELDRPVSPLALFEAPTVRQLARLLCPPEEALEPGRGAELAARRRAVRLDGRRQDVAIIGMAGRFPKAASVDQLWDNLMAGREGLTWLSDDELLAAGVRRETIDDPRYVRAAARLDGIELFDARLFGYAPREAAAMDPQHRLFLECAWHALEDAGCDPDRYPGLIGVWGGANRSSYLWNIYSHPDLVADDPVTHVQAGIGNTNDSLTTRVSYKLNLRGPSVAVQTFCSTGAVAIHMARQSLLHGECDMALAGGVRLEVPQDEGYLYEAGGVLPRDGHTRTFDAAANGSVLSNGVAIVVLKRLADAVADGDRIYAVIKGSAINNDGAGKVGYTAPSIEGQAEVVRAALEESGVPADSIHYLEAHGTATELGDPIEVAALSRAFGEATSARGFCQIGSLKPNLGHLDRAAGAAAVIKASLTLCRGEIPPQINYSAPNPKIDFAASPFRVETEARRWPAGATPRRASVNVLGMGGTNVHLVLEEAPQPAAAAPARPAQLLVLSAHSERSLEGATAALGRFLSDHPEVPLADVAHTLQTGRRVLSHRRTLVCRDAAEAAAALLERDPRRLRDRVQEPASRGAAFLFAGVGDHYVGMGHGLYAAEPVFREVVDRCAQLLRPTLGLDLREVLYPAGWQRPRGGAAQSLRQLLSGAAAPADPAAARLTETRLLHPAQFAVEYALARQLMAWGVRPAAVAGYSLGEYVAACVAGVFSLEDALTLVAERGRLIDELPEGAMLAVALGAAELLPLLADGLSLAAVNGPELTVAAGGVAAIEALAQRLGERGATCRRLAVARPFHAAELDAIAAPYGELVGRVQLHAPRIPMVSTVTGGWLTAEEAVDPQHWTRHMSRTVRFAEAAGELLAGARHALVEIGPGQTLGAFVALQRPAGGDTDAAAAAEAVPTLRHADEPHDDVERLLAAIGRLWQAGIAVDWPALHGGARRRVSLPLYEFDRERYWIELDRGGAARRAARGKRADLADWFYTPSWKPALPPAAAAEGGEDEPWLVLANGSALGHRLLAELAARRKVIVARIGERFTETAPGEFEIDLARQEDYEQLFARLGGVPAKVVHLWCLGHEEAGEAPADRFARDQELGLYSLLALARAAGRHTVGASVEIVVLTSGLHAVTGAEPLAPGRATLLAACNTVPQEFPGIAMRSVDVELPAAGSRAEDRLAGRLLAEIAAECRARQVAWRGSRRLVRAWEPLRLPPAGTATTRLRQGGVYLITGGLGEVGSVLAADLARRFQARLVLAVRSLGAAAEERRREIERLGGEVLVVEADAGDAAQLERAVARAIERFGTLHGVIHAAGISRGEGFGVVQEIGRRECELHFRPKVHGVLALERALAGRQLDFCLLMSSLSAVLGGITLAAYGAANLFMDAWTAEHNRGGETPWIAVDWDTWRTQEGRHAVIGKTVAEYEMTCAEGAQALERILAAAAGGELAQVVVSTGDLEARIEQWIHLAAVGGGELPAAERHGRPRLGTPYVAPESERERTIAAVWSELLGVREVGLHDDFFELGGHSLLGIQLFSRLRDAFQVELPLRSLFEVPTVAGQAELVATLAWVAAGQGDIDGVAAQDLAGLPERAEVADMAEIVEGEL